MAKDDNNKSNVNGNENNDDNQQQQSQNNEGANAGAQNQNQQQNQSQVQTQTQQQSGKVFTQDDVSRMMAKEKQQGRNAVFNELGINADDADAIALVKAVLAAKNSIGNEDDSQKLSEELQAANRRAQLAEYKADAMKAGVKSQFVDDAVSLAVAQMSGDNSDFNAVLNELKSKYSIWFDDSDDKNDDSTGKRGTGRSIGAGNNNSSNNNENQSMGKRLAAMRRPNGKKSSYFSS